MLINGRSETSVSALDRGLQYGDGLFETLAVAVGRPALWERHLQRLESGCRRLAIPPPSRELLFAEAASVIDARQRGVLKILVSRGVGGRGYRPPAPAESTRIVSFHPWPDYPQQWWLEGIRMRVCNTRLGESPALTGIKHLGRLEQVLARAEWDDPEIAEGLMLDITNRPVEGTMSNLFVWRDGNLITPGRCGVAGVMRGLVMETAREQGIPVQLRDLELDDLEQAEALFMTNSLIGIWPVRELEGRRFDPACIPNALMEAAAAAAGFRG